MLAVFILLLSIGVFAAAYRYYGRFLCGFVSIDPSAQCPSRSQYDGMDYVPAKVPVLLGHHFSSIAGVGPIVGPVLAVSFGWLPALIWILFGSVFIGGVHDFMSLVISTRHKGRGIGEITESYLGKKGKALFLLFTFFTLLLVLAVFAKVVAASFSAYPHTATTSLLFMGAAVVFSICSHTFGMPLSAATIIGLFLLAVSAFAGYVVPLALEQNTWIVVLLVYGCIASILPVWILLQPRDYLNSYLLYLLIGAGLAGVLLYRPDMHMPCSAGFSSKIGPVFPLLFITVACGAVSGFHSIVATGTTSKQLTAEPDALPVGYGSMLIEGALAVIALIVTASLAKEAYYSPDGGLANPVKVFSSGLGTFLTKLGLSKEAGTSFTALAISAFALTTLDTCARLARFTLEELTGMYKIQDTAKKHVYRTAASLVIAGTAAFLCFGGTAAVLWPAFGTANQLLAALSLLTVTVWLKRSGLKTAYTLYPMIFMFVVTLSSLVMLVWNNIGAVSPNYPVAAIGAMLVVLAGVLLAEARKVLMN